MLKDVKKYAIPASNNNVGIALVLRAFFKSAI